LTNHKFPYRWNLADGYPTKGVTKNNLNVFGTFICGGGSTMGYKLAGYNHLGGVEIDKKVAAVYKLNHNPKHLFVEDLRAFNQRNDLQKELYSLDILDGSPPCSTFSMAGNREKDWGKEKVFREGQTKQTLDDLMFVYTETILKLRPKVAILENVKGLIQANARAYLHKVTNLLKLAGYSTQVFLLNAASMGVPKKRERVFLIARQTCLNWQDIQLKYFEPSIAFGKVKEANCKSIECFNFPPSEMERLALVKKGDRNLVNADKLIRGNDKNAFFNQTLVYDDGVMGTITGQEKSFVFSEKRRLSFNEIKLCGTYPQDYNFIDIDSNYLIGMSVPPVMIAQIATSIKEQWFDKIESNG
jgi:DNA (cytosine-5)-methyltransferase 1